MIYPGSAQVFFGELLNIINFDLFEQIPFMNIQIKTSSEMASEYHANLGFIGFESCSLLLNMNTFCWFLLIYFAQIVSIFLAVSTKFCCCLNKNKKISNKLKKEHKKIFYGDLMQKIEENHFQFLILSIIQLIKASHIKNTTLDYIQNTLAIFFLLLIPTSFILISIIIFKNYR